MDRNNTRYILAQDEENKNADQYDAEATYYRYYDGEHNSYRIGGRAGLHER